jgi:hypothetical protein
VTGVSPGPTAITARIAFTDGSAQQTPPRAIIVSPLAPIVGTLVAEGTVDFDGSSADYSRYIPFTLPRQAAQLDMVVDWVSVLNALDFVLYRGTCSGNTLCGGMEFIPLAVDTGRKPVRKSTGNLAAGSYTIRIDNVSSRPETARYEIRLTPP